MKSETIKCAFFTTYYDGFLNLHYGKNENLFSESYEVQRDSLINECFGDSFFYSKNLSANGFEAQDFITNCLPLQESWKKENCVEVNLDAVIVEQIKKDKPDVVYLHNLGIATRDLISQIRPFTKLIVGQIASGIPPQAHLEGFDIIFSSFPHFVNRFRAMGITSYYQPLAFEKDVLNRINNKSKTIPVSFIGGFTYDHKDRIKFVEELASGLPIEIYGYGADQLHETSSIRKKHKGELWGLGMFQGLSKSRITINNHIDTAENFANNMRLFEATGCGSLLITDYKDNLNELFEIGKEIVAYRSAEECVALVKYYLNNPSEAEKIAQRGQQRTLKDHSYKLRMKQTAEILKRHLRYKYEEDTNQIDYTKISSGYKNISKNEVNSELTSAWQSEDIPQKQRTLVQQQLLEMYDGKPQTIFLVLAELMRPQIAENSKVLEIGCASGYYYEILEYLLNKRINYTGVDYSEALIKMARDYYPDTNFEVADGAALPFENNSFEVAISSCVLLHVPNFVDHIRETVRVADKYVIAHRTPVCRKRLTQYFKKSAYGVETVELRFNEEEIVLEFVKNGLELISGVEYYSNENLDEYEVSYLFRKG